MRKTATAALFVLLGVAFALGAQKPGEWVRYNSTEGRYNVLLPAQPKLSSQEATGATGEKFTQYMASVTDADSLYMLGYFDYSGGVTFSLDKARDGMLDAIKGTMLSETAVSLGGKPGRDVKVSAKANDGTEFDIRARFYDVGGRVYVIQMLTPKASVTPAHADKAAKFFDSFQVVNVP